MRYPRWLRLWSCVLSIGCGLIQTGAVGTTDAAESESESATAENVPEAWTRLAACRFNLKHEGEAWREPLKIDLSFDDPACVELHAAEAQLVSMLMMGDGWPDILVRFALAALIIPAIEEIAFRGFLQDVASRRMRRTWAIGLVSVLFGLLHGFTFALPLAAVGVCLSILRERHRSLWVPMGAHMLNNAISFACIHLVAR